MQENPRSLMAKLKTKLGRQPTVAEYARFALPKDWYGVWAQYSNGSDKLEFFEPGDDTSPGKLRVDFPASFQEKTGTKTIIQTETRVDAKGVGRTIDVQVQVPTFITIKRTNLVCFDCAGMPVALNDLPNLLKNETEERIRFRDILQAWGIKDPNDRLLHQNVLSGLLVHSVDRIVVRTPPNEAKFLKLMEDWYAAGIPTTIEHRWHGCYSFSIPSILTHGLQVRDDRSGKRGSWSSNLFGSGIYCGMTDKAQDYSGSGERAASDWRRGRNEGHKSLRFLLKLEVMLGRVYRAMKAEGAEAKTKMLQAGCQSVHYHGWKDEWVIYNPAQVLVREIVRWP